MSAIAKPYIKSTTSTTPERIISAEDILDMSALDVPHTPPRPNEFKEWHIRFQMKDNDEQIKQMVLAYTTSGARDSALTAAVALLSANV